MLIEQVNVLRRNNSGLNIIEISNIVRGNSGNETAGNQTSTEVIHPIPTTPATSTTERNMDSALSLEFGLFPWFQ